MQYRRLGRSGLKVSALSLSGHIGAQGLREGERLEPLVRYALERGVNHLELADVYGRGEAERAFGELLQGYPRHQLVLSSRCFWPMSEGANDRGLSRKHLMESVEGSLKRLNTDYLDVLICQAFDNETPLEETLRALEDLIRQGKLLYWGVGSWSVEALHQVVALADRSGAYRPISCSPLYHLQERTLVERALAPTAKALGLGLLTWGPLAGGALTGAYQEGSAPTPGSRGERDPQWLKPWLTPQAQEGVTRLCELAEERGVSAAQLAIAWALSHPQVSSVSLSVSGLAQLEGSLEACSIELSQEEREALSALFA